MAEYTPKPPFRSNYVVDGNGMNLELYRLFFIQAENLPNHVKVYTMTRSFIYYNFKNQR